MNYLTDFVRESNWIEGIKRAPLQSEVNALKKFIALPHIDIKDLEALLAVFQPDAVLRTRTGQNVRVGGYHPPEGGPAIKLELESLLRQINAGEVDSYKGHCAYEKLHPFTDGNGRTGRALWLWHIGGKAPLGFLHTFYYQTLRALP